MVWQMAIMLCILEKRYYGLEGMKKSHRLMEGKRIVGLLLAISNSGISSLLCFTAAKGNVYIVRLGSKIAYGLGSMVMACAVALMGLLTQSVLYFVCKRNTVSCRVALGNVSSLTTGTWKVWWV
ncbi:hypothetical protein SUGI_1197120 [Cryptomeria japonica]|nr:hypothetical protein SUGI_1197120 [Cryptomeria japonica]